MLWACSGVLMVKYFSVFKIIYEYNHGSKFCTSILYEVSLVEIFIVDLHEIFMAKKANFKLKGIK